MPEVAKNSAGIILDKKMFSPSDFIKLAGFIGGLVVFYITSQISINAKFSEIKEAIINSKADSRILISRVELLEAAKSEQSNRTNELEKFRFQTEAVLSEKLRIKKR